jgi:hypothetical protein
VWCSGCSCSVEVLDALASCTAEAQCDPELVYITLNSRIFYTCPNQPVANSATTSGMYGGYNLYGTENATAFFYNRGCHNAWALIQCDGYRNSGVTLDDLNCCSPPPPPPPPQSTCPSPQGQPPSPCNNPVWDTGNCTWTCSGSPIIIDISRQGFSLTNAANGVRFDISGTGHPIQMGWTAPGADNAFLALPDVDGLVHGGKQLFGNSTPQPPSDTPNGFAALAVYDDPKNGGNGDGVIDSKDAIFSSLRLWIDSNHDGISQPEELHTLPSVGVNSISLNYKADQRTDQWGNVFQYRAQVNPGGATSTGRIAYDVFFVELNTTTKNNLATPVGGKCQVPDKKVGMLATAGGSR